MTSAPANPVVVIFTDNDGYGRVIQRSLQHSSRDSWPEIQVEYIKDPDEFERKMQEWGERVQGVSLDVQNKEGARDCGAALALHIRDGVYGNRKDIPIFLYSMADFMPPDLDPPARISKDRFMETQEFVDFFLGCKTKSVEYEQPDLQAVRDGAAEKLVEFLQRLDVDLQSKIELAMSHEDRGNEAAVAGNLIRHHTGIAFSGGAPTEGLLEQLQSILLEGAATYYPDDQHYNQYALVRGELRSKVDAALKSEKIAR